MPESDAQERQEHLFELGKTPMVFIGLGGSGGEVVARLKDLIRQQFADPNDPAYQLFQFLVIDGAIFETLPASVRHVLDRETEFCFIGGINPAAFVDQALSQRTSDAGIDLRSWLGDPPPPRLLQQMPREVVQFGAERLRQHGRVLLYAHRTQVLDRIRGKLRAAGAVEQMVGAAGAVPQQRKVQVFVAAGTCGGTGSAIFFDILHMVGRVLYAEEALSPEIIGILVLPSVHLARWGSDPLVPYYRANGYAFWEELCYLLREPGALNNWVLDAASQRWQSRPGSGIPGGHEPLHWLYLFDDAVPGVGYLTAREDASSLFAWIAKALFHHITALSVGSAQTLPTAIVNFRQRRTLPDHTGARKLVCTIGFSEVRFPVREVLSVLTYRFARRVIEERLLKAPDRGQVEATVQRLYQQVDQQILEPLRRSFGEIETRVWKQCEPQETAFDDARGKFDPDKVTLAALNGWFSNVQDGAARASELLSRELASKLNDLRDGFERILKEEVQTASGFAGLELTRQAFASLDDLLEARVAEHRSQQKKHEDVSTEQLRQPPNGDKKSPIEDLIYEAAKSRLLRTTQKDKLRLLVAGLKTLFDARVGATREGLFADFLLHLAGEEGDRRPELTVLDPTTGRVIKRVPGVASLDRYEDEVLDPILAAYRRIAQRLSDDRLKHVLWAYEGRAVTSCYVPSTLSDLPSFDTLPEVRNGLDEALKKSTEYLLKGLLAACPPLDMARLPTDSAEERVLQWASTTFKDLARNVDVFALAQKEPGKGGEVWQKATRLCEPPLKLSTPIRDEDREHWLAVVQSPDPDRARSALPGFRADQWPSCPPGGVYLLRQAFVIPPSRVQAFGALQGDYFRRDRTSNFPHLTTAWSAGGVPGSEGAYRHALETYARARALDWWIADPGTRAERLSELGILEDAAALVPFGFVGSREERRAGGWNRIRVFYGNFLVSSGSTWRVERTVDLTRGVGHAGLELLLGYVSSDDLVESHRKVLDHLERTARNHVEEICTQWREQKLRRAIEDLARTLREHPDREPEATLHRWYSILWQVVGGGAVPGMASESEPA